MFKAFTLFLLAFASLADAQQLTFAPYRNTGIYAVGEKAGWTVTGPPAKYTYEIKKNNFEAIKSGTLDLSSGSATIEATLQEPAMLYVTVTGDGVAPVHAGAAIAPTQLQPSAPHPPDFDAFWLNKIQYLSVTPMNAIVNPMKTEQAGVELSSVQVDSFGSRLRGYVAKPIKLGRFPALIMYNDADVALLDPKTVTDRAAEGWLAFNIASHDVMLDRPTMVPPNIAQMGNGNRETAYLLLMYLRDARAVDYICSRYDWDGDTLVLMGNGMGGQQALIAGALRQQVSAVIAGQPTGADLTGERVGRKPGFPNWLSADPRAMATAPYFDVVNFAGRIRGSVLASVSFTSTEAPPAGIYVVLNQIRGPHELIPDDAAFAARSKALLDSMLHGKPLK